MATQTSSQDTTLQITRTFQASREKIFKAWTDPKQLMQWFAPSDQFATPLAEVDLRVGGSYRIQMKAPDGETHTAVGVYRVIVPPEKLVFTWSWEAGGCGGEESGGAIETEVTVLLRELGGSTELTLTHTRFPSRELRDRNQEGWTGCLDRLAKGLTRTS